MCRGKGEYGGHACEWCDGLGAKFSDVIFRGHPAYDGCATVIEGCPPVHLDLMHEGDVLRFERACESSPPYWFIKEDGKQVFRYIGQANTEVRHARADADAAPSVEGGNKFRPGPER